MYRFVYLDLGGVGSKLWSMMCPISEWVTLCGPSIVLESTYQSKLWTSSLPIRVAARDSSPYLQYMMISPNKPSRPKGQWSARLGLGVEARPNLLSITRWALVVTSFVVWYICLLSVRTSSTIIGHRFFLLVFIQLLPHPLLFESSFHYTCSNW